MPTILDPYDEALAWLYARTRDGAPRDPRHMRALLSAFGLPDPPASIHVVGTNGKGTVSTMLAAGLQAAGLRAGRFLSPHVEDFRERIAVDGVAVSRAAVARYVTRVRAVADRTPAAFFEHTLALALETFAAARVEVAVLEAGVGGARDATRAIEGVRLLVLTNVSLDHLEALGPGLLDIARDKAGAIRGGVPVVTGAEGEALELIVGEARRLGAPLFTDRPGDPLFAAPAGGPPAGAPPACAPPAGGPPAGGQARQRNGRLAAAALRVLGYDERAVAAALAAPALPARAERFAVDGRAVLLDGAHDPAAAALLAAGLEPGFVLLFGALARKQGAATLAALEPKAARVLLTEASPGEAPLPDLGGRRLVADPVVALDEALACTGPGGRLVIAGSLYLAGALRPHLRRRAATPPPGSGRVYSPPV